MKTSTIGLLVVGGLTLAFAISAVAFRLGPGVPPRLDSVSEEGRETLNMLDRLDEKERLEYEERMASINRGTAERIAEAAAQRAALGNAPPETDPDAGSTAPRGFPQPDRSDRTISPNGTRGEQPR